MGTIQTLTICCISMSLSTYVTYLHYKYMQQDFELTSAEYLQCSRVCHYAERVQSISISIGLTVVISFWGLLWQYVPLDDPVNYQVHGTVAMVTLIDFYLCYSIISFKKTILYVIVYGTFYIIWSILYQLITDDAIYPVMDWQAEPVGAVIVAVSVFILAVILHLLLCWTKDKLLAKRGYYDMDGVEMRTLSETITQDANAIAESYGAAGVEQEYDEASNKT